MKPIAFLSLLFALMPAEFTSAAARDVLAHASGDRAWVARVGTVVTPDGPADETTIFVRQSGPGQSWGKLITIPARASELAARSSTLVVLLANGTWMSVCAPDGAATGSPLPAGGRIRALGDDGENLWAVGTVNGGLAAAQRAVATQPATNQSATLPTTIPSVESAVGGTTAAVTAGLQPQPVLFEQRRRGCRSLNFLPTTRWMPSGGDVSIAVVAGRPMVSFELANDTNSYIFTIRLQSDGTWDMEIGSVHPDVNQKFADFELISAGDAPVLWVTGGKSAGRLYPGAAMDHPPIDLKRSADHPLDSIPAVTFSGGYLRVIGLSRGKLYEHAPRTRAEIQLRTLLNWPRRSRSTCRFWNIGSTAPSALPWPSQSAQHSFAARAQERAASNFIRRAPRRSCPALGAGILDLLPVLLATTYIIIHTDDSRDPGSRLQQLPALIASATGIAIYLLHTTLT